MTLTYHRSHLIKQFSEKWMNKGCPRCKTTKYRNPSLKLMVNVCGHNLCENCVELLFVRGSGKVLSLFADKFLHTFGSLLFSVGM